jgi:hypothetical protein
MDNELAMVQIDGVIPMWIPPPWNMNFQNPAVWDSSSRRLISL